VAATREISAHPPAPPAPVPARPDLAQQLAAFQAALPGSRGAAYLQQRGIPLALAQQLGVGYAAPGTWPHPARDWHGGRVVFPHTTPDGHLVNLYGRAVSTEEQVPKAKRHDHLPGEKGYFNAAALQASAGPLWVCEGAFDALALLAAGVSRVVAIFGVHGWRWDWVREVRELVFALDADAAGQQQWRILARQAALRGKQVAVLEPAAYGGRKDVNEAWVARTLAVNTWLTPAEETGERGLLSLRTSTRPGQSASPSCSRMVTSCPRTLNVWRGRESRPNGRCGDAWDHTPYRSGATSACQGTLVSALRGLVERAKLTQHIRMLSGVLRGERSAVDSRPALSASESTWLDGPRTDAACPRWAPHAMEVMPGAGAVIRPVGPAYGLGRGDGGRLPRTLEAPRCPLGRAHDARRSPPDRPLPWQVLAGVCASGGSCLRRPRRRGARPWDDLEANEPLPADRTPFRMRITPLGTPRLPPQRHRHHHGGLPHVEPTAGQRLHGGMMGQSIAPHRPRLGHGHMHQPALEKGRDGHGQPLEPRTGAVSLLLTGATGAGDAVSVPRHAPGILAGAAAQRAGEIRDHPGAVRIALHEAHMPLRLPGMPQTRQEVEPLVRTHRLGQRQDSLRHRLAEGGEPLPPERRPSPPGPAIKTHSAPRAPVLRG
jgi:hypothetical protein